MQRRALSDDQNAVPHLGGSGHAAAHGAGRERNAARGLSGRGRRRFAAPLPASGSCAGPSRRGQPRGHDLRPCRFTISRAPRCWRSPASGRCTKCRVPRQFWKDLPSHWQGCSLEQRTIFSSTSTCPLHPAPSFIGASISFATLLALALGVSADAFAVAVGRGLLMRRLELRQLAALAFTFGGFQALMPLIGYSLSAPLLDRIARFGPWIAAGVLAAVAAKMIVEALSAHRHDAPRVLHWPGLIALGLATSIDALAVGISLVAVDVDVLAAALVIGTTTLLLTVAGAVLGQRLGSASRRPAELAGGLMLLGIAVQILVQPGRSG